MQKQQLSSNDYQKKIEILRLAHKQTLKNLKFEM